MTTLIKLQKELISAMEDLNFTRVVKARRLIYLKKRKVKLFWKIVLYIFLFASYNYVLISSAYLSAGVIHVIEIKIKFFIFLLGMEFVCAIIYLLLRWRIIHKYALINLIKDKKL